MTDQSEQEAGADTVPVHGIVMRRSSLPSSRFGAWLVEKMQDGWVYLKSADLTATNKITRDHYNQICDELDKTCECGKPAVYNTKTGRYCGACDECMPF